MIQVTNLTKIFGNTAAVDGISFSVKRGEIVGFLGPNGAGKTTTMRLLTGFISPTAGSIRIDGMDILSRAMEVRARIGYLPENAPLYPEMRINEYLRFRGRLKGLKSRNLKRRMDEVLQSCGLTDVPRKIIGTLSKGFRQRVGLADCLIHEPDLLILDEPTIGLDPNQIRQMRNLIGSLAPRHTVLLSSHILPEVEATCGRVMIINRGRIVASDTAARLAGLLKGNQRVILEICTPNDTSATIAALPGVASVTREPLGDWTRYLCECTKDSDVREPLFALATTNGWRLRELRLERQNLEEVFVSLTSANNRTEDGPSLERQPEATGT